MNQIFILPSFSSLSVCELVWEQRLAWLANALRLLSCESQRVVQLRRLFGASSPVAALVVLSIGGPSRAVGEVLMLIEGSCQAAGVVEVVAVLLGEQHEARAPLDGVDVASVHKGSSIVGRQSSQEVW